MDSSKKILWILGAVFFLDGTHSPASEESFFRSLGKPPVYDGYPDVTLSPPLLEGDWKLFSPQLIGKGELEKETWSLKLKGVFKNPSDSLLFQIKGKMNPLSPDKKGQFELEVPMATEKLDFELLQVKVDGTVKKENIAVSASHYPLQISDSSPFRWLMDLRGGLHFAYEGYSESNSLATSTTSNIRLPRAVMEFGIKRARSARGPAWKALVFGSLEYSLPLSALGSNLYYPLAWSAGVRFSREHLLGRLTTPLFSPFLQLERQGITFTSAYLATLFTEPVGALTPSSLGALWAQLGGKLELYGLGRIWEVGFLVGRSILATAWASSNSIQYTLGGYGFRLWTRTDLTKRFWAEAYGHFELFSGTASVLGGGGGLTFGMYFNL